MLSIIWDFIIGYICIKINSNDNYNRLINLCKNNNLNLWNIRKYDDYILFNLSKKDIKQFKKLVLKTDTNPQIIVEKGLPFLIKKYKTRVGFILGALFAFTIIYISSFFIWHIEVIGSGIYTDEEIINYIENNSKVYGVCKYKYDCKKLEVDLRDNFDKISWINCNIDGTNLVINLSENNFDVDETSDYMCDIVANKDCIIDKILVKKGNALHNAGDKINKGEVIVSGTIPLINEFGEETESIYVNADAIIYGLCTYIYEDEIDMEYYEKEYTTKKSYYSFGFGRHLYTPYKLKVDINDEITTTQKDFKLSKSFYLPIYLQKTTIKSYNAKKKKYTKSEVEKIANKRFTNYINELQKKEMKITQNNVTISIVNNKCIIYGDIIVKEQIGTSVSLNTRSSQ